MPDYASGVTIPHSQTDYRFAPIPEALLYDPSITPLAVRVYGVLMRHGLDPASCFPSHERIGKLVGVSDRSIQRPCRDLEKAGWISRVRRRNDRGERTSDGYFVHTTPRSPARTTALELPLDDRAETSEEREPVVNESNKTSVDVPSPGADVKSRAKSIVDKVWKARQVRNEPVPANYMAACQVVEKMLRAGWADAAVGKACLAARTISTGALEFELRKTSRPQPVGTTVDEDRTGQSGRIDL